MASKVKFRPVGRKGSVERVAWVLGYATATYSMILWMMSLATVAILFDFKPIVSVPLAIVGIVIGAFATRGLLKVFTIANPHVPAEPDAPPAPVPATS